MIHRHDRKSKIFGETFDCCQHCHGCYPPNEHLSRCTQCKKREPIAPPIASAPIVTKPDRQGVYRLMFEAQKRGRWFW